MSFNDENQQPSNATGRRPRENALQLGPRKKPCVLKFDLEVILIAWQARCTSDPLMHYGRHFGRTVHALCSVNALITNGLLRDGERADEPEELFTAECMILLFSLVFHLISLLQRTERISRISFPT